MDILPYGGNHGHSTNKWFALKKPAELTNSTRRHLENLPTGKLVPSPAPATEPETGKDGGSATPSASAYKTVSFQGILQELYETYWHFWGLLLSIFAGRLFLIVWLH